MQHLGRGINKINYGERLNREEKLTLSKKPMHNAQKRITGGFPLSLNTRVLNRGIIWKVTRKRKRRTALNKRKNLFAYMYVRENYAIEETHPYRIGTGYRRRAVVTTSF